jgi:chaperonin cofactor prefoldin
LQNLQQNIFVSNSKLLNQKEKLVAHLATLFYKRQEVEETLIELKSSTIFEEITKIPDLNEYFATKKEALTSLKTDLESRVRQIGD